MEYRILKSEEMEKAFALREEVFVDEQKVPLEYEIDKKDSLEDTIHVGVFEGDELLATARIMNIHKDIVYFGRACVKKSCRGKGVGKFLFISMEETVKKFKKENEKKTIRKDLIKLVLRKKLSYWKVPRDFRLRHTAL